MSIHNFVSYGDAETLMSGIKDTIDNNGYNFETAHSSLLTSSRLRTPQGSSIKYIAYETCPISKPYNNANYPYIWSDGIDIFYDQSGYHYIFNKATKTWSSHTWGRYNDIDARYIWTDGTDIFYSNDNAQYVLNDNTWSSVSWSGYTPIFGHATEGGAFTDGTDIYWIQIGVSDSKRMYKKIPNSYAFELTNYDVPSGIYGGPSFFNYKNHTLFENGSNDRYEFVRGTGFISKSNWKDENNAVITLAGAYSFTDGVELYFDSYVNGEYRVYIIKDLNNRIVEEIPRKGIAGNYLLLNIWTDGENLYLGFDRKITTPYTPRIKYSC